MAFNEAPDYAYWRRQFRAVVPDLLENADYDRAQFDRKDQSRSSIRHRHKMIIAGQSYNLRRIQNGLTTPRTSSFRLRHGLAQVRSIRWI